MEGSPMHDEEWQNGICSHYCGGDCGVCWASWCCLSCLFGRTSQRLEKFPDMNKDHFDTFNAPCLILYAASYFHLGWIPLLLKRQEMRRHFGIKGNGYTDCLASYFCACCTAAQMEMEIKDRAAAARKQAESLDAGYASQQHGMIYSPPAVPPAATIS